MMQTFSLKAQHYRYESMNSWGLDQYFLCTARLLPVCQWAYVLPKYKKWTRMAENICWGPNKRLAQHKGRCCTPKSVGRELSPHSTIKTIHPCLLTEYTARSVHVCVLVNGLSKLSALCLWIIFWWRDESGQATCTDHIHTAATFLQQDGSLDDGMLSLLEKNSMDQHQNTSHQQDQHYVVFWCWSMLFFFYIIMENLINCDNFTASGFISNCIVVQWKICKEIAPYFKIKSTYLTPIS